MYENEPIQNAFVTCGIHPFTGTVVQTRVSTQISLAISDLPGSAHPDVMLLLDQGTESDSVELVRLFLQSLSSKKKKIIFLFQGDAVAHLESMARTPEMLRMFQMLVGTGRGCLSSRESGN